jgi:hypothetical protein
LRWSIAHAVPGVSFPKLALFFALVKMFRVSGTPPLERLGLGDYGVAESGSPVPAGSKRGAFLLGFAIHPLCIVVLDRSGRRLGCFEKPV